VVVEPAPGYALGAVSSGDTEQATDKDAAMIGHWPVETFGRPLWTRRTFKLSIGKLVTTVRSDPPPVPPSADRRLPGRSQIDRDACHQFQYRNLSDDPYHSLELDGILESPRRV
jgi:hypothetical protein